MENISGCEIVFEKICKKKLLKKNKIVIILKKQLQNLWKK